MSKAFTFFTPEKLTLAKDSKPFSTTGLYACISFSSGGVGTIFRDRLPLPGLEMSSNESFSVHGSTLVRDASLLCVPLDDRLGLSAENKNLTYRSVQHRSFFFSLMKSFLHRESVKFSGAKKAINLRKQNPRMLFASHMHCESKMSCSRTQHNVPAQGSNQDRSLRSRTNYLVRYTLRKYSMGNCGSP